MIRNSDYTVPLLEDEDEKETKHRREIIPNRTPSHFEVYLTSKDIGNHILTYLSYKDLEKLIFVADKKFYEGIKKIPAFNEHLSEKRLYCVITEKLAARDSFVKFFHKVAKFFMTFLVLFTIPYSIFDSKKKKREVFIASQTIWDSQNTSCFDNLTCAEEYGNFSDNLELCDDPGELQSTLSCLNTTLLDSSCYGSYLNLCKIQFDSTLYFIQFYVIAFMLFGAIVCIYETVNHKCSSDLTMLELDDYDRREVKKFLKNEQFSEVDNNVCLLRHVKKKLEKKFEEGGRDHRQRGRLDTQEESQEESKGCQA